MTYLCNTCSGESEDVRVACTAKFCCVMVWHIWITVTGTDFWRVSNLVPVPVPTAKPMWNPWVYLCPCRTLWPTVSSALQISSDRCLTLWNHQKAPYWVMGKMNQSNNWDRLNSISTYRPWVCTWKIWWFHMLMKLAVRLFPCISSFFW